MEIKFREIYLFWRDCFTKKRCDSLPKLLPSARWMVEGGSYSVPCTGQPSLLQCSCACACQCTGQPSLLHISDRDQRWTDQWAGGCRGQQTLQYLIGERFSKVKTFSDVGQPSGIQAIQMKNYATLMVVSHQLSSSTK